VPPAISVIVPARNAEATIAATLAALRAQRLEQPFEVIVVDSGSSDGTATLVAATEFTLLHNPGGEPAGSRNLGAARATAPVLAFTDSDCEPDPDWLAAGLAALNGSADAGAGAADLVAGRVLPAGPVAPFQRTVSIGHESGLYETANLFVRRDWFQRVGGFELLPQLRLPDGRPFGEDAWFAWRCKWAGARSRFSADAVVRHAVLPGTPSQYLREQARRGYFPALVAQIPELRSTFLHRRWFLSPQTLRFGVANAGLGAGGVIAARPGSRATLAGGAVAALAATPYLRAVARDVARVTPDTRERARLAVATAAGDAIGAVSLIAGSIRARTLVL
jgi:glycosyltransferase involved in cell wall biosynthesis